MGTKRIQIRCKLIHIIEKHEQIVVEHFNKKYIEQNYTTQHLQIKGKKKRQTSNPMATTKTRIPTCIVRCTKVKIGLHCDETDKNEKRNK